MKEVKFTRQELYDLVWTESILSLSKKYAISDVGLRKKCKKLEIPLPYNGYWAKVQFGKKTPARNPLRKFDGEQEVILYTREEVDEKSVPGQRLHADLQAEIENDKRLNLIVPERLTNPDRLIISVKDDLYKKELWNKTEDVAFSSGNQLDIRVNPVNIGRALRFMDTLIKAIRTRGHEIKIENGKTNILIDGEEIQCCFREKLKRVIIKEDHYESSKTIASGVLSFRIEVSYNAKEWADGKKPIEDQLSLILTYIELKAKSMKEERIEREKRWKIQEEKERIAKELQERKEKELKDFKDLFKDSARHDRAEMIRSYADKLEKYSITRNELTPEIKEKIQWIKRKADWYDPFIEADDELLQDVDREELNFKKKSWWG